ncbi:hypothetical protein GCM10010512_36250 [Streptomyces thermoviolaceus subsp. thermoviolaceus]|uniref:DUF2690 domain-containing protein n=1 Tax=Streptomyces thermoviolaceus subsp. thermoviolaceus TaxID=66860 RepID=A0ABX0YV27_STRTL|nr:XRE family transcriptional regulator [Streptomyces thermoviolaceus]NJP14941.1 DUF2690 domain-containing protein [Streptomyces thermoviolaceus subsp. thermoviolaceus]GHB01464.1 hypothetical protein GCM10010512_36250 [Streptomyces thermoviolaceus subsp. thermoviolaceus]
MTAPGRPAPPSRSSSAASAPSPSPELARLTAALRQLRQRTGLSLAALAQRTTYSKSSWERYLNGKTLPPRRAVEDLCLLAREPAGRCLALWEIAESEWSRRSAAPPATPAPTPATSEATAPPPSGSQAPSGSADAAVDTTADRTTTADTAAEGASADGPARPQRSGWFRRRGGAALAVLVSVCAVTVGSLAAALAVLPHREAPPRSSPSAPPVVSKARCRGASCEGRDPMQLGCSLHLVTVASYRTATDARLELRYHEQCRAGWARIWHSRIGDRLTVTAGGPTRTVTVLDSIDAASYVYTPMTAAGPGTLLRACFHPADGGRTECFTGRVQPAASHTPPTTE